MHRPNATVSELLKGLPPEFVDTVGALFGELTGVYDSAHGLSEPFRLYMGVLMRDALSPDRAKILLDAVALAIRATAIGAELGEAGDGKRLLQILYADDWAGLFGCVEQLLVAWSMWNAFTVASGCSLGIAKLDKTVVAGVGYDADGTPFEAYIPELYTHDGRRVCRATLHDDYHHMGRLRRVHGVVRGEDARMRQTWRGFLEEMRSFNLRARNSWRLRIS